MGSSGDEWCSRAVLDRGRCVKGKGVPVCMNLQQGLKENLSFCDFLFRKPVILFQLRSM